ncbi:DUF2063 domain-containing protein [Paraglaciecola sp.]|uniref:HvfC family RiPP maturation protein n=1 Tax=Paraglaciecola sp. TaxID=1920173 RepID=UPI00273F57AA|nr:putative DNA-binding domain-containing protein [Paraglaciecola sp.]MDP5031484.1 putative DNA-binding domain-containing protein [Paraglaciecola sp.]
MTDFKAIQQQFIAHLKDPDNVAFDYGIEDRRLKIYRELFFNNILGFLSSGFPVLASIYQEQEWLRLARQFFASHRCRSPYFTDISLEFVEYLSSEHQATDYDPPFLSELAHYEWLELSISIKKCSEPLVVWEPNKDDFPTLIQFSPLATLVSYHYPVHRISVDFQPHLAEEPVYLVVYRNNKDDVNFSLINQVSAHLLNVIQQNAHIGMSELLAQMQSVLPQINPAQLNLSVQNIVEQMLSKEILLPTKCD